MDIDPEIIKAVKDHWGLMALGLLVLGAVALALIAKGTHALGGFFALAAVTGVVVLVIVLALGSSSNGGQGPAPTPPPAPEDKPECNPDEMTSKEYDECVKSL